MTGWAAGTYQISFQAAQRLNVENGGQDFEVIVDNTIVGTFKPTGGSYQTFTTAAFDIAAGTHTITFQGLDTATNDNTAFIDAIVVEVASVPIVADAGFEQPTLAPGTFDYSPVPGNPPWSFSTMSGISENGSGFTMSNPGAPEGSQVAILQEHSSFSQMVPGWAAGTYQISFQAAQRLNVINGGQDFDVLVDNNIVGTFKPTDGSYQTFTTAPFNVTAGPHTITFQGLDSVSQNTALIDAISVSQAVPQSVRLVSAPSVGDAGFEHPDAGPAGNFNSWVLDPTTDSPWTFAGPAGVSANNSGYTGGGLPSAPEGVQVAFLQQQGSFSQTVNGWTAGSYQISFQAAQRAGQHQDFQVLIDTTVVGTFTPTGSGYQTYTTAPLTLAAGTHTITFKGLDTAGGDNTALIDAISVSQVVAQDDLSQYGVWTQDNKEFLLPEHVGDNIAVYYDAPNNQLELAPAQVQGGVAELYGQILNTGTGNINVLDGFGQINVTNNTTYTLVTNTMSTGEGTAGQLKITDTGKQDGAGHPLVTEYVRQNGQVYTNSYYANADGSVATVVSPSAPYSGPNAGPRSASYQPATARLVWEDGQNLSVTVTNNYQSSSWLDIIQLGQADLVSTTTDPGTPEPLLEGEYIQSLPAVAPGTGSDSADYEYSFQQIDLSQPTTQYSSWKNSTWYGTTTYYEQTVTSTPRKNINTHSIRADRPININFVGLDAGDPNQQVSVETKGDLQVDGSIANDQGSTTLSTVSGAIDEANDSTAVGGQNISLTAVKGIGATDPLRLNMTGGATPTSPNPGTLNATTTSGDINLNDVSGSMTVEKISTGTGDVTLSADESIFAAATNTLVTGGAITLNADFGSVGSLGTNGTANAPGGDALPITIDVGSAALNKLNVTARSDVFVRQASAGGDLRLNKISSVAGNVRVEVPNGNLIDANNISIPDTQNLAELETLWNQMLATPSTAQVSINNTINAYESQVDQNYQTYWQFRNQQPNPAIYDPSFEVTLSPSQSETWTKYFTSQGTNLGYMGSALASFVQNAITTLENQQTQEYHTLNATFGKLGNSYDPNFRYYANQTPLNVGPNLTFGPSNVSGAFLTLTGNPYTTGQAVVYHANGGAVSGLTDSDTYYVIVNPANPDQISLAASYANATAVTPVPIALSSASGTENTLSEIFQSFGASSVDPTGFYISLPGNVFTTGQAMIYHANGGTVAGLTDGDTYYVVVNPNDPTLIGLDASSADAITAAPTLIALGAVSGAGNYLSEVDVESQRAAWSESQLQNSIDLSIVDPRDFPSTLQTIPDSNIEGKNVALMVKGDIGAATGQDMINLPLSGLLPQNVALDLAAAQPADITFFNADGTVAHPADPATFKPVRLTVNLMQGVSLENSGSVDASAGGNIDLVSGKDLANSGPILPITIDGVTATGSPVGGHPDGVVRILGLDGILNGRTDANAAIRGGNLFLEGGNTGGIGASSAPLVIDLARGALLEEANAENGVYITEPGGDLNLVTAFSQSGVVSLTSGGSILNGNSFNNLNIAANGIILNSGNSIGTTTDPLAIELTGGSVVAQASSDINLDEVSGDLIVSNVLSRKASPSA